MTVHWDFVDMRQATSILYLSQERRLCIKDETSHNLTLGLNSTITSLSFMTVIPNGTVRYLFDKGIHRPFSYYSYWKGFVFGLCEFH